MNTFIVCLYYCLNSSVAMQPRMGGAIEKLPHANQPLPNYFPSTVVANRFGNVAERPNDENMLQKYTPMQIDMDRYPEHSDDKEKEVIANSDVKNGISTELANVEPLRRNLRGGGGRGGGGGGRGGSFSGGRGYIPGAAGGVHHHNSGHSNAPSQLRQFPVKHWFIALILLTTLFLRKG